MVYCHREMISALEFWSAGFEAEVVARPEQLFGPHCPPSTRYISVSYRWQVAGEADSAGVHLFRRQNTEQEYSCQRYETRKHQAPSLRDRKGRDELTGVTGDAVNRVRTR